VIKSWPENGGVASFTDLCEPIVQALADAVGRCMVRTEKVKRRNGYGFRSSTSGIDAIEYHGYDIGEREKVGCSSPDVRLSKKQLQYDWSEQGRTPVDVLVALAVQLGIEQGRRIAAQEAEKTGPAFKLKLIKSLLDD
jgi:hypothetical protein